MSETELGVEAEVQIDADRVTLLEHNFTLDLEIAGYELTADALAKVAAADALKEQGECDKIRDAIKALEKTASADEVPEGEEAEWISNYFGRKADLKAANSERSEAKKPVMTERRKVLAGIKDAKLDKSIIARNLNDGVAPPAIELLPMRELSVFQRKEAAKAAAKARKEAEAALVEAAEAEAEE
jgi:hypothetical protein